MLDPRLVALALELDQEALDEKELHSRFVYSFPGYQWYFSSFQFILDTGKYMGYFQKNGDNWELTPFRGRFLAHAGRAKLAA